MKLSVIIVNYNVKFYLEQCLCSLYKAIDGVCAEVFVVDNASSDDSKAYITIRFPKLTYIYNEKNVGFACANNQAIRQAQGEYILLLNPDTLLPEDNLTKVLAFMDAHPKAGAAGVKMITSDGTFLKESKRGFPSPMASFWKLTGIQRLFPHSPRFNGYYLSYLEETSVHRINVLAGAFMMLRRTALDISGLLDEDFFMYGEDIDLSCRVIQAGYENYYLPFPILHYKGESTSKNSYRYVKVFYGAMEIFFRKHGGCYPFIYQWMVQVGIKLQMGMMLAIVAGKRGYRRLCPKKVYPPCFLVFANDRNIQSIRMICKRNNLDEQHRFMLANEMLTSEEHSGLFSLSEKITHVVYDNEAFSYSKMLDILSSNCTKGLQLGVYDAKSCVLVTPEKTYL